MVDRGWGEFGKPDLTVLFDLDGVLVDSQAAEAMALFELGLRMQPELTDSRLPFSVAGRRMQESIDLVASWAGRAAPSNAMQFVRERAEYHLDGQLKPVPHIADTLRLMEQPRYVVSNSPLAMIEHRLEVSGLTKYFPGPHFSAYEVESWKPDPGLYLRTLDALGIAASDAVAIEDSGVGMTAAADAGIDVYWYQESSLRWPDIPRMNVTIFHDMRRLPSMLQFEELRSNG